jgi:hypothetical protein
VTRSQFFGGHFDDLVVAQNLDRKSFAGMFFHHFFDGRLKRQLSSLYWRQFKNI